MAFNPPRARITDVLKVPASNITSTPTERTWDGAKDDPLMAVPPAPVPGEELGQGLNADADGVPFIQSSPESLPMSPPWNESKGSTVVTNPLDSSEPIYNMTGDGYEYVSEPASPESDSDGCNGPTHPTKECWKCGKLHYPPRGSKCSLHRKKGYSLILRKHSINDAATPGTSGLLRNADEFPSRREYLRYLKAVKADLMIEREIAEIMSEINHLMHESTIPTPNMTNLTIQPST